MNNTHKKSQSTNAGKGISERLLKNAMVYLVENDEDEFSDKHKISLFDDSKFEEGATGTIDKNKLGDSLDQSNLLMGKRLNLPSGSSSEHDDDDSSDDDAAGVDQSQPLLIFERESMVLMGENVLKEKKKKRTIDQQRDSNALLIASDDEDKQKMLSDLNSNMEIEEDISQSQRQSIFRSRQSSKR